MVTKKILLFYSTTAIACICIIFVYKLRVNTIDNRSMDRTRLYQFHMGLGAFLGKRERRYGAFFEVMYKNCFITETR